MWARECLVYVSDPNVNTKWWTTSRLANRIQRTNKGLNSFAFLPNKVVILTRLLSCRIFTIILEFHALWVYKINYGSDYWCTERMMNVMLLASIYGMKRIGKTTTLVKVVGMKFRLFTNNIPVVGNWWLRISF